MFIGGKLEVAKGLFSKLSADGIQPPGRTYNVMIKGLLKEGLSDEAYELFRKWKMMKHNVII
jgi:pentatricopeptide repeat protein